MARDPQWPCDVVWFFFRGDDCLKLEVRHDGPQYEIAVDHPDGTQSVKGAETPAQLLEHVTAIPRALLKDGWRPRLNDALFGVVRAERPASAVR